LEPAHFAQYVLIGLVICLFKEKSNIRSILFAVFVTLGIVLSTSGQGLLVTCIVWIIFILDLIFGKGQSSNIRLLGMVLSVVAFIVLPFVMNSEVVQNNLARILMSGSNTAVSARAEGYTTFFSEDMLYIKIFGAGFGNTPLGVWFSGLAYILYCSGIVGFLILLGIFIKCLFKSPNRYAKMLIFVCFLLSVSAEIINSYWIVFMFSLICYSNRLNIKHRQGR
jgi:hypothetical protein